MKEKEQDSEGNVPVKNWILRNLLLVALLVGGLMLASTLLLNSVTNHGRSIEVPDLTGLNVSQARKEAARQNLKVDVYDSIFVRRMAKGAVYSQNPKAGARVKKGRRIMLTINAVNAKKVSMPNLVGYSMRQAKAELSSKGMVLGRLIYMDDIATNNVLKQLYHNREIKPGKQIETGSEIDLAVGLNSSDNQTYVPNVKGMKYLRAVDAIRDNSLNIKQISFDKSVKTYADSLNATVVRQSPTASKAPILMGSEVSIYLSVEKKEEADK